MKTFSLLITWLLQFYMFSFQIRWVVDATNARIKRWKYLAQVLPTNQVPFIGDNIRIVCAISNRYCKPLSTGNEDEDLMLASKMRYLSTKVNSSKAFRWIKFLGEKVSELGGSIRFFWISKPPRMKSEP